MCYLLPKNLKGVSGKLEILNTSKLGKGSKKNIKKLTNVSLYVCMSAENSKMLVFVCFFSSEIKHTRDFQQDFF